MENGGTKLQFEGHDITFDPKLEDESYAREHASRYTSDPFELVWRNLTLSVPVKVKKKDRATTASNKVIWQPMSGYVRSGQMLLVVGASGAGKMSLLNLLDGRITTSKGAKADGVVEVNGKPRDYSTFREMTAYVMQDDDMFEDLTVREQIRCDATLRLLADVAASVKEERVSRVTQNLGLAKVAHVRIGGDVVRGVGGACGSPLGPAYGFCRSCARRLVRSTALAPRPLCRSRSADWCA